MLIWRGYGLLVLVALVVGILLSIYIERHFLEASVLAAYPKLADCIGLWLGAAILYGISRLVDRSNEPRTFIDKATGREIVVQAKHDLFFIPLKYWPLLLMALGVVMLFTERKL